MRIISVNVNGIRAAHRKNFFTWLQKQDADVVCIQETKAQVDQLIDEIIKPKGYFSYFNSAVKKGYSGVAIYSRVEPDKVIGKIGWKDADREGRFLQANFGKLSVISLYLPSGSSSEERQAIKFDFLDRFSVSFLVNDSCFLLCRFFNRDLFLCFFLTASFSKLRQGLFYAWFIGIRFPSVTAFFSLNDFISNILNTDFF